MKKNLRIFPLKSGTRQGCPVLLLLIILLKTLRRAIKKEKQAKRIYYVQVIQTDINI